jgi:oxaloacetate decarboxylase alpha subunit
MESQLREQGAADKLDDVLAEIPRVREDLGYLPLVTPTSQIVGTQAVLNVLTGERYKSISKETVGVLKGEYGSTPAPVNAELQAKVLDGVEPITCRPADELAPEFEKLQAELRQISSDRSIALAEGDREQDDVLTYALFPQIGLKFLENRGDTTAFEPMPEAPVEGTQAGASGDSGVYTVTVSGQSYVVQVAEGGDISAMAPVASSPAPAPAPAVGGVETIPAPLAGNIFKVNVAVGEHVQQDDVIVILEAMKMETEVRANQAGVVASVSVKQGDAVTVGDTLITLS